MKLWNKSSNLWKHSIYQSMSLFNQVKEKKPSPPKEMYLRLKAFLSVLPKMSNCLQCEIKAIVSTEK